MLFDLDSHDVNLDGNKSIIVILNPGCNQASSNAINFKILITSCEPTGLCSFPTSENVFFLSVISSDQKTLVSPARLGRRPRTLYLRRYLFSSLSISISFYLRLRFLIFAPPPHSFTSLFLSFAITQVSVYQIWGLN